LRGRRFRDRAAPRAKFSGTLLALNGRARRINRPAAQIVRELRMTPQQVKLIQESFAKVAPIADTAASLFYGRLFEIAPEVRSMFKGDIGEQGRKLMATLALAVNSLEKFDQLQPALTALAQRHAGYGVRDEHYAPVGMALIWTLEQGLGESFTDETREAWLLAYAAIAETMKAGAANAA
jgi:nitric oxide dioxygenase